MNNNQYRAILQKMLLIARVGSQIIFWLFFLILLNVLLMMSFVIPKEQIVSVHWISLVEMWGGSIFILLIGNEFFNKKMMRYICAFIFMIFILKLGSFSEVFQYLPFSALD